MELKEYGKIADEQLCLLPQRFPYVSVMRYVIMPNHIHMILKIKASPAGASPRPTIMDVVCAYKSLTTMECKKVRPTERLFQKSFYEHVIRNKQDYLAVCSYIENNPANWIKDKYYSP